MPQREQGFERPPKQQVDSPLKEARRAAGLSERELAEKGHVSLRSVQRLSRGDLVPRPKLETIYRLAWALGCERISDIVDPEVWLTWDVPAPEPPGPPPRFE